MTNTLIVGAGVDTFIASMKQVNTYGKPANGQDQPVPMEAQLQEWQELARSQRRPFTTTRKFNETPLLMMMGGSSTWKYILHNNWAEVRLGARLHLGMLAKMRLSNEYLWSQPSLLVSLNNMQRFLNGLFLQRVYLQAGQIDLCVDLVGLQLPAIWEEVFITHAISKRPIGEPSKDRAYYGGRKLETLQFSGHGNPMHSKLYNKVKEIQQHSPDKVWFRDLWRNRGWDGTSTVWRKEFSLERAALREMLIEHVCPKAKDPREPHTHCKRIESVYDVPMNLQRLWTYCTHDWLRMVIPLATKNRKPGPLIPSGPSFKGRLMSMLTRKQRTWDRLSANASEKRTWNEQQRRLLVMRLPMGHGMTD